MITRRSMLGVMLAAACGPAIVRASSLMAVKPVSPVGIVAAESMWVYLGYPWKYLDLSRVRDAVNESNEILRDMAWRAEPEQRVALPA